MRLWTYFQRSCRRRCPVCGEGEVCRGWFTLNEACPGCGLDFRRDPGFYLGSIYINYGLTALILTAVCTPLVVTQAVSPAILLPVALAFCVLFPLWFLRYARSLWLGFDQYFDQDAETIK